MLIFLEGGFACWDRASCLERNITSPQLMTSRLWSKDKITLGGVFSDRSVLANFTLVYVPYCSSDSWVGNSGDATSDMPFVFRGNRVVQYLTKAHLASRLQSAGLVILGGCSAGGRGAWYNLDQFCDDVSVECPRCKCRGLSDAAWWVNQSPFAENVPSLWNVTHAGVQLWNATILQNKCGDVLSSPAAVADCFFGEDGLQHVTSGLVMHSQQYDAFQLNYSLAAGPPYSSLQQAYANSFAGRMFSQLTSYGSTSASCGSSVFSTTCFNHCITLSNQAYFDYEVKGGRMTLNDVVDLGLVAGRPMVEIDACEGMNCSAGCPKSNRYDRR